MSKYTTELRYLHDQGFDFGLDLYPIFDESYRETLNKKILAHYRYREIGAETPQRFRHYLVSKMNEIMPLYNQMYKSELLEFNPLYSTDYTETSKKTSAGDSTVDTTLSGTISGTTSSDQLRTNNLSKQATNSNAQNIDTTDENPTTQDNFSVSSDTPGGLISVADIKSNTWASQATRQENAATNTLNKTGTITDTGTDSVLDTGTITDEASGESAETSSNIGSSTAAINNVDDYIKTITGNMGSKNLSELLLDFRATFLNIDLLVIDELNECFMGVY